MNPKVLYSTQTKLAWQINRDFYHNVHYVWCSDVFDPNFPAQPVITAPSSTPFDIYKCLTRSVMAEDSNCSFIHQNRAGLKRGAKQKLNDGVISQDQFIEIKEMIRKTYFRPFQPLVYIILYDKVADKLRNVPPAKRATAACAEYQVFKLEEDDFSVIAP